MASGERRLGTSRRGMTVLGKIPTPSVPKPINLPSQRSENRGLEPNVEIVPRGTFSWGNAGNSNAAGATVGGASGITSSPPTSSGAWNGGTKALTSGKDVGSLAESNQLSSSGNGTRPLSAPTIATSAAGGSSAKTQAHVQVQSSGFTVVPLESVIPNSNKNLPQLNETLGKRPTSSDGTVGALELHRHPGVSAYAGATLGQKPCPERSGDDYRTFSRQGMPPAGPALPVGAAHYLGAPPHETCFRSFGIPHYSSPHNRDMLLVRMVNNPGAYERSYQPHHAPVECFGQSGVPGSYRPQIRNVEQFATLGHHAAAGGSGTTDMRVGFFPSGNNFLLQEREGFCESGQDLHKYKDGQFGSVPRDWGYPGLHKDAATYRDMTSLSTQSHEYNHTTPGTFRSHNHLKEAGHSVKQEVAPFATEVPQKKIILLTKTPRVEAQKTESSINNSSLLPDCHQGSETREQERKKPDGCEVRGSANEITTSSLVKQDVHGGKEELLGVETGRNKLWSAGANTPSPTVTLTAPDENLKNEELKVHSKWDGKSDAEAHQGKSARQARKVASQGGLEPVRVGGQPVCKVLTKQIVGDDVAYRDDQRLKIKALNHSSEKAWRPKSPVVESVLATHASSAQAARGEKNSEKHYGKATDRGEPSQEWNRGDLVALDASTSSLNKKIRKRRNIHALSNLVSSGISSKVEASSVSVTSTDQQPNIAECVIDQLTNCENERETLEDTYSSHACNITGLISQGLSAEASNIMESEGFSQSKAKGRPHQKAEKEWRPKSPALEVIALSDSIFQSQANEANIIPLPISDGEMRSNHESKILEQEGSQAPDTYDYEGQRARLKEIAAQRAKDRLKEEEERAREQRAKSLAKLEELERRTLANSSTIELNEHVTGVLTDEAPNRKTKKRLTSSRCPATDISLDDLEKRHLDEASVQEAPASPMVDKKEVLRNEETVPHKRNMRYGFDRNSSKNMEDCQVHESSSGTTSSSQVQKRISRRDPSMDQEGLPPGQDTEADLFSSKKHGVKKDEGAKSGPPRRQKGGMHNQVKQGASNHGSERSVIHAVDKPEELTASSADFLAEKVGRLHVSWRQKNSHGYLFLPNTDKPKHDVEIDMHSALEESFDAPTQSRKPRKIKNGGKQASYVQQGPIQLEGYVMEERSADTPGPAVPELRELIATFDVKHEAEANFIEQGTDGGSRSSWWRQKNGKTGSHGSKLNLKNSAHLEAMDEACEKLSNSTVSYALSSSQTSCLHNPRNKVKHSLKAASGVPQWHKVKPPLNGASFQEQEEENTPVSASWDQITWSGHCADEEQEQEQKAKIVSAANHARKRGLRPLADAKLPLGTTDYKYQDMHSVEVAEFVSGLPMSRKNRLYHTNAESRRTMRPHQATLQAVNTHDQPHEAVSVDCGEQQHYSRGNGEQRHSGRGNGEQRPSSRANGEPRPSSRGNKPSRQRQFNGCWSVAELDRRDAKPAVKTGISY